MAWNQDCKFINEFAQSSAKNLAHVHSGVIITIQMDTNHLDKLNEDLKLHGPSIPVIENMKSKKESVEYFNQHKDYYFSEMHKILRSKKKSITTTNVAGAKVSLKRTIRRKKETAIKIQNKLGD